MEMQETLLYTVLQRTHEEYDFYASTWKTISELRDGAPSILRNIEYYLPMKPDETRRDYQSRMKRFSYTPIFSTAIKDTAAKLAASPLYVNTEGNIDTIFDFIRSHNDVRGTKDERTLVQDIFLEMLYYGKVYITADRRPPTVIPRSKAEEVSLRLPYLNILPVHNVIDWNRDDDWFKVREIVADRTPTALEHRVKFTYYMPGQTVVYEAPVQLKNGEVWKVWNGTKFMPTNTPGLSLPMEVYPHNAPNSLVTVGELPAELWVGCMCYLKQIQHMNIESSWGDSGVLAGTIQRVFTPSPPVNNDNPAYLQEEPEYDKVLLGNRQVLVGASFQFVESTGQAIRNLTDQLKTIESQIKGIVSMKFATAETSVLAQSGVSKMVDQVQLINTMRDYGNRVRHVYEASLRNIALLMGFPPDDIMVQGLNDFNVDDIKEELLNAVSVDGMRANIPLTVQKLFWQKISKMLTGTVSTLDEDTIRSELDIIFDPNNQPTAEEVV